MEFIYCRRLNSQYFGAHKSGAPKMQGLPAVASILRGVFLRHWAYLITYCRIFVEFVIAYIYIWILRISLSLYGLWKTESYLTYSSIKITTTSMCSLCTCISSQSNALRNLIAISQTQKFCINRSAIEAILFQSWII